MPKSEASLAANRRYAARWPERIKAKEKRLRENWTPEQRQRRRDQWNSYYARHRADVLAKKEFAKLDEARKQLLRERRKQYYAENRAAQLKYAKQYRERTVEQRAAYASARAKLKPEVYRAAANRRRARLAGCFGDFTSRQWSLLKGWYGNKCAKCRQEKKLHADHVTPITKGGSNMIENIQPLCKSCNSSKGTRIVRYPTPAAPFPCHP